MPDRISPSPRPTATAIAPPKKAAFALSRLRRSRILKACMLLAFVEYGALAMIAIFGRQARGSAWPGGAYFPLAGWVAIMSLGSWFFLFAWFPALQRMQELEGPDLPGVSLGRVLETFAIGCVALVHLLLALLLATAF
jgi:hypothetical protein